MLPIPDFVVFLPVCVLAGIAIVAVVTQLIARIATVPVEPPAALAQTPRPSAQIYYFTGRKTPLGSNANRGGSRLAMHR